MLALTGFIRNRCVKNRILNLSLIIFMLICSSFVSVSQAGQIYEQISEYESLDGCADTKAPVRGSIVSGLGIVELDKASTEETTVTQRINNDAESLQKKAGRIAYESISVLNECFGLFIILIILLCVFAGLLSLSSRMIIYIHNKDGSKPSIIIPVFHYYY